MGRPRLQAPPPDSALACTPFQELVLQATRSPVHWPGMPLPVLDLQFCRKSHEPNLTVTCTRCCKNHSGQRCVFRATHGPAITVEKGVACKVGFGESNVLLVHISVCLGECECNGKNTASELGGKRNRLSAWPGWESSRKI